MRKIITIVALLAATSLQAEPIELKGGDGFKLGADYYAADKPRAAVLMLHQCNADRSMYDALGKQLAKRGISALSLDFRLYGDSTKGAINIKTIRASEPDRAKRRQLMAPHRQQWPADVLVAEQYLRQKVGSEVKLGVVGASCGGTQALALAADTQVDALMFFSSGMNDKNQDNYRKLSTIPTFIIAAEEDTYTYNSAQNLFKLASHGQSRLVNYKGRGHGHPLFDVDLNLKDNMVSWFSRQLITSGK